MRPYQCKTHCKRGHHITGANLKPKPGGKACRACECALSQKGNLHRKHGLQWGERDVQQYADLKYSEFRTAK